MDYIKLWFIAYVAMTCLFFVIAGLPLLVTRLTHHFGSQRRIQKEWPSRSQYLIETLICLRTLAVNAWMYITVTYLQLNGMFPIQLGGLPLRDAWWQITMDALLMIIAFDAYFFWTHIIMHKKPLFRFFHLEHHLTRTPTPLTSLRMSIPEALVYASFPVIWIYFMPYSPASFVIAMAVVMMTSTVGHCGFEYVTADISKKPLMKYLTTVLYHDMHHLGGFNSNYAISATWWDRLLRTYHPGYEDKLADMATKPQKRQKPAETIPEAAE